MTRPIGAVAAFVAVLLLAALGTARAQPAGLQQIERVVVIFLENRSFDNMFGLFPGANGIAQARPETTVQVDRDGRPYALLPPVMDTYKKPPVPDPRFPPNLPNRPFLIDGYVPLHDKDPDLVHRWYQQQAQINGGRMNKFAAISDAGGLVMGYHDGSKTRLWEWARQYTLADNFFHAAFGGSFLNHFWLVCACTPRFPNAPRRYGGADLPRPARWSRTAPSRRTAMRSTPLSRCISRIRRIRRRRSACRRKPRRRSVTGSTRRASAGPGYSGGWNAALAGNYDRAFQFHHQPFAYFRNYGDGTEGRRLHLKDEADLYAAIENGTLPAVSFYKPVGEDNEHPGYASIALGDARGRRSAAPAGDQPDVRLDGDHRHL